MRSKFYNVDPPLVNSDGERVFLEWSILRKAECINTVSLGFAGNHVTWLFYGA